jgi:membrane-bound ClpP family serine protease
VRVLEVSFWNRVDMKHLKRFKTLPHEARRRVVLRYGFFQIPDLLILILILWVIQWWVGLPSWLCGVIVGLWITKDVLMFPFAWRAYETSSGDAVSLIGSKGIVEEELNPSGYVRVHGELWKAEAIENKGPIEKGETVLVRGANGLTLFVQPIKSR